MIGTGLATVVIMADDAFGIGVADDTALPLLYYTFSKGVEMVAR